MTRSKTGGVKKQKKIKEKRLEVSVERVDEIYNMFSKKRERERAKGQLLEITSKSIYHVNKIRQPANSLAYKVASQRYISSGG